MKVRICRIVILICILVFEINMYRCSASEIEQKLQKYWWGYRRYIDDSEVEKFSEDFDTMAAEFGVLGGLSIPLSFLHPLYSLFIGGFLEFSSSYCWLLSTKISKFNNGNGVILDMSKGLFFRIKTR